MEEWSEADGQLMRESPDGGTTATVIALVDGCSLVHAQCGDSNAMLGGEVAAEGTPRAAQPRSPATRRRPATSRLSACERTVRISGEIEFNELIKEHSATNLDEYVRVQESPRGHRLQFVYCVEELMDRGEAPKVFKLGAGGDVVAVKAERLPEVYPSLAPKNARGELPAVLLAPEEEGFEPQNLAMTRSLGDFLMQVSRDAAFTASHPTPHPAASTHLTTPLLPPPPSLPQSYGVSHEPEVIEVDLGEVADDLRRITLVVASDGLWDVLEEEDAAMNALAAEEQPSAADAAAAAERLRVRGADGTFAPSADGSVPTCAAPFFEKALDRADELFDDAADNITAIVVTFTPGAAGAGGATASVASLPARGAGAAPVTPKGASPTPLPAACFSV